MRTVYWEKRGKIAAITVDNPPLNVQSMKVIEQLQECLGEVAKDRHVSAIVVTGAGKRAFMAGGDIEEFQSLLGAGAAAAREHARWLQGAFDMLDAVEKPTIAAIEGFALGGGCELALACDLRVAAEGAKIGLPEINLGIFPGAGGTQRLPRLIGASRAKELMFTGEPVSARTAKEMGLVNRVVPDGEALEAAQELAESLVKLSLPALSRIKRSVDEGVILPLSEGLEVEAQYFGEVFQTEDAKEGVEAFIQKRASNFMDR